MSVEWTSVIAPPILLADANQVVWPQSWPEESQMNNILRLALLSLSLCVPVQAQDRQGTHKPDVEVGDALVCDTREQVERYIAFYNGDQEAAVRAVNREEGNPTACGVVSAAFMRGAHVGAASQGNMAFDIVRILVVGIDSPVGFRAVRPAPYFAAFGVREYSV
jgi:hypothetical protein